MITKKEKQLIIDWLCEECNIEEVNEMLQNATITKTHNVIFIQYDNNYVDIVKIVKGNVIGLAPPRTIVKFEKY